jgi:hypothetical protein
LLLGVHYIRNTFLWGKDSGVRYTGLNCFYSFPSLLTDPFSHFYSPRRVVLSSNAMRETPTGPSTMSSFPTKNHAFFNQSIKKTSPRCSSLLLLLREDNSKNLFYFSSLSYPPLHLGIPHSLTSSHSPLKLSSFPPPNTALFSIRNPLSHHATASLIPASTQARQTAQHISRSQSPLLT